MFYLFNFLFATALILYLLVAPAFGIVAWHRTRKRENSENVRLRAELDRLHAELAALKADRSDRSDRSGAPPPASAPLEQAPPETVTPAPRPPELAAPPAEEAATPEPAPARTDKRGRQLEESFASKWLVWLGAGTIAIGSIFLVKYSIDQGWLNPTVRISAGILLGLILIAGGEWLRQRPLQRAIAALRPDFVPQSLTAAGLFAAMASIYAGYVLYDLFSPLIAFILMAAFSLAAIALSILQGPVVALLGLVAGYLTPILVQTGHPMAWGLFPYLLLIAAAGMTITRMMGWRWLAWAVLAGALLWPPIWYAGAWQAHDTLPVGIYLLLMAPLLVFPLDLLCDPDEAPALNATAFTQSPELPLWVATGGVALMTFGLVRMDGYHLSSLVFLALIALAYLGYARIRQRFAGIAVVAAILVVPTLALWHLPSVIDVLGPLYSIEGVDFGRQPGPVLPPQLLPFLGTCLLFGALFGGIGYVALWGAASARLWAGVSAAVPILLMIAAYWRARDFAVDFGWGFAALLLAGLALFAATRFETYRDRPALNEALGIYAAAVVAGLSLALTMTLRDAWLTVGLAVELPALAWLTGRLRVTSLYWVAWVLAPVVILRLVLNPFVLDYPLNGWPILNWILFGYGLPAVSFFFAARWFAETRPGRLIPVLESGMLAFAVLLVTFQIRHLMSGSLTGDYDFAEACIQMTAWLSIAYGLAAREDWRRRFAFRWAWRALIVMSLSHLLTFLFTAAVDWFCCNTVGETPIFNWLILAFAVPAVFCLLFARLFKRWGRNGLAIAASGLGLYTFLVFLFYEVRQFYHGGRLWSGEVGLAEQYSYSVVWLIYGLILLALGLWRHSAQIRWASLAVVMLTVLKVFLIDMSELEGLYRVASFVGLGLSLIAIGFFYQRFVIAAPAAADGDTDLDE